MCRRWGPLQAAQVWVQPRTAGHRTVQEWQRVPQMNAPLRRLNRIRRSGQFPSTDPCGWVSSPPPASHNQISAAPFQPRRTFEIRVNRTTEQMLAIADGWPTLERSNHGNHHGKYHAPPVVPPPPEENFIWRRSRRRGAWYWPHRNPTQAPRTGGAAGPSHAPQTRMAAKVLRSALPHREHGIAAAGAGK